MSSVWDLDGAPGGKKRSKKKNRKNKKKAPTPKEEPASALSASPVKSAAPITECPPNPPKPNAPCWCGSKKKYKKCHKTKDMASTAKTADDGEFEGISEETEALLDKLSVRDEALLVRAIKLRDECEILMSRGDLPQAKLKFQEVTTALSLVKNKEVAQQALDSGSSDLKSLTVSFSDVFNTMVRHKAASGDGFAGTMANKMTTLADGGGDGGGGDGTGVGGGNGGGGDGTGVGGD